MVNTTAEPITVTWPDGYTPAEWTCAPGNWLNIEPDGETEFAAEVIMSCVSAGLEPVELPPAFGFVPPAA